MNKHIMKLQELPFRQITQGSKVIEVRLNDEKRQQIKVGDSIKFRLVPDLEEEVVVEVIELLHCNTFRELYEEVEPVEFGGNSVDELVEQIMQHYSSEQEAKYGVLGIRLQVPKNTA
jgi:ASC-1-like (ASCH) protein